MIKQLQHLGLSDKEAAVYMASLELGSDTVQEIAKRAEVKRANTYAVIEKLMSKGLMSSVEKGKKTLYQVEDPKQLLRLIEEQEEDIKKKEQEFKKHLPELETLFDIAEEKPKVRYFEGKKGLIAIREDYFKAKNKEVLGIFAIERVEKILQLPMEQYEDGKKDIDSKNFKGSVEFKNIFFTYKKNEPTVLKDISFKVNAGETIALVGESGVGKSTAMELVSGYYFPTKGKVLIDGYNTKETSLRAIRQNIAMVPQEPVLFNDTVKHNIRYGNFKATDEEIKSVAKEAHADVFIEQFPKKYNQVVGERGIRLSVGQKQRIAIARAMLRNPKILILDEPTSALDAKTEKFITESLERLMKDKTTFVIAHRLSTVRKADKILVFKEGRIVEEGKHDDLIKIRDGVYKYLYEYQIGLH